MYKIFDVLPIALRPSLFYNETPVGFAASKFPGFLTPDGGILFPYESAEDKFISKLDDEKSFGEQLWPCQLVVPLWEFNSQRHLVFLFLLFAWLYTDLPDFISPTPGICLTNVLTLLFGTAVHWYGQEEMAKSILDELNSESSLTSQSLFFAFHVFKIAMIYLVFRLGIINPASFNFKKIKEKQAKLSSEILVNLGWTGVRRATLDEWREAHRDYKVKKLGGLLKASRMGALTKIINAGVLLESDEGFGVSLNDKYSLKTLATSDKLLLSQDYFDVIYETHINTVSSESLTQQEKVKLIKDFRKYGPFESETVISDFYEKRKQLQEEKDKLEEEKKNK